MEPDCLTIEIFWYIFLLDLFSVWSAIYYPQVNQVAFDWESNIYRNSFNKSTIDIYLMEKDSDVP